MATIWDRPYTQTAGTGMSTGFSAPGGSNLFYQPGSGYGQDRDWNTTPVAGQIREQNPNLAYAQYGQGLGIADNDNSFNRWFYQQYPRFQQAYGMATLQNPMMNIDQFVRSLPGMDQLRAQFNMLSPEARGLRHNSFAPNVRWIGR